jgi:hypothetical protein
VEGIKNNIPDLARYFIDGLPAYDPRHPDNLSSCNFPASQEITGLKPDGD